MVNDTRTADTDKTSCLEFVFQQSLANLGNPHTQHHFVLVDVDDTSIIAIRLNNSNLVEIYCYQFVSGIEIYLIHSSIKKIIYVVILLQRYKKNGETRKKIEKKLYIKIKFVNLQQKSKTTIWSMKKIITMLMLVMFSISAYTQELKIKNFSVAANDISASQYERKDNKGVACALVKILIVGSIKDVKGNVVGEIADKGSEKWVYVQNGSKTLQLTVADGKTLSVDFNSYGIPEVMSKATYLLEILEPTAMRLTKDVETVTVNGVTFKMIRVDGGTFKMGTNKNTKFSNLESPVHEVTLSTYYIGETEVTNELWCAVTKRAKKYSFQQLPQSDVSWSECKEFTSKLSQLTGLKFRLLTEAEWEFAAKGGNKSKGYKFSGGNDFRKVGWTDRLRQGERVHTVKGKIPNELGIYDMTGNVDEWCEDWYSEYPAESQLNPVGQQSAIYPNKKIIRGGYYGGDEAAQFYVFHRKYFSFSDRSAEVGFRLAVSAE